MGRIVEDPWYRILLSELEDLDEDRPRPPARLADEHDLARDVLSVGVRPSTSRDAPTMRLRPLKK
jgi:hypothetical protein